MHFLGAEVVAAFLNELLIWPGSAMTSFSQDLIKQWIVEGILSTPNEDTGLI
jgi:hypothetical protein